MYMMMSSSSSVAITRRLVAAVVRMALLLPLVVVVVTTSAFSPDIAGHGRRHDTSLSRVDRRGQGQPQQEAEGFPRVYRWRTATDDMIPVVEEEEESSSSYSRAARRTWNWCRHFVVPHDLCPWAAASVRTRGAVSLYLVEDALDRAVHDAASRFWHGLNGTTTVVDARTAIAFVVDVSDTWLDFDAFYEYHYETLLEDFMDRHEHVMLAPFHPAWRYGGGLDDGALNLEKRSPYPTISIVAQHVLDQAGSQATERIAQHNEEVLRQWDLDTWKRIYREALEGKDPVSDEPDAGQ